MRRRRVCQWETEGLLRAEIANFPVLLDRFVLVVLPTRPHAQTGIWASSVYTVHGEQSLVPRSRFFLGHILTHNLGEFCLQNDTRVSIMECVMRRKNKSSLAHPV